MASPLTVDASPNSIYVYVKVLTLEDEVELYGMALIKLRTLSIRAYHYYIPLPTSNCTLASVDSNDANIVEIQVGNTDY